MAKLSSHKCFGGTLSYHKHASNETKCDMRFTVFLPPGAEGKKYPFLFFLAGLTCTEENFTTKAGAYKRAAELGIALIAPDTSPRGDDVPDQEGWDFGKGAGFYLDATEAPWNINYRMESYIARELYDLVTKDLPLEKTRCGIFGHSMGGHGALSLYFKYPEIFKSVSAFSPIAAPMQCPWGEKAFTGYLGADKASWKNHDASQLVQLSKNKDVPILIDQGLSDPFLKEQLKPEIFEAACRQAGQKLLMNYREGYDHGYFFIQSFLDAHLEHHASILG